MSELDQHSEHDDPLDLLLARVAAAGVEGVKPPGAEAARRRGRQRAVRHRLAVSALALVLVAGVAGVAATKGLPGAGLTRPSPAGAGSTSPVSAPSAGPSTGAHETADIPPNLDKYVAAAWLGPTGLPFATQIDWQKSAEPQDPLFGDQAFRTAPGENSEFTPCNSFQYSAASLGAQEQLFTAARAGSQNYVGAGELALDSTQVTYYYPGAAAAQAAWADLSSAFQCPAGTPAVQGTIIWFTAGDPGSQAVCSSEGVRIDPGGYSEIVHDCFVRYGALISMAGAIIEVPTNSAGPDFTASDRVTLLDMKTDLSVYRTD